LHATVRGLSRHSDGRYRLNIKFNQLLGSGNVVVGDNVTPSLNISAVKQAEG